jgi:hypothetical protein
LIFDYQAQHDYDQQGNIGHTQLHRAITLRIEHATSAPLYLNGCISFRVELAPQGAWHTCLNLIPCIDDQILPPRYGCRSFVGLHNEHDQQRVRFLDEATAFSTPESTTRRSSLAHSNRLSATWLRSDSTISTTASAPGQ